jgi:hypothetical protein
MESPDQIWKRLIAVWVVFEFWKYPSPNLNAIENSFFQSPSEIFVETRALLYTGQPHQKKHFFDVKSFNILLKRNY